MGSFAAVDEDDYDEIAEKDFSGFLTSDEEEEDESHDTDKIKAELDEDNLLMSPSQNAKNPRMITTSNRGQGKSPTKARPKAQYVIDLTSDGEDEAKSLPRPPAKLPVRPAVVIAQSKYIPVGNNPLSAYAQTYRANNFEQSRKHRPKK